MALMLRCSDCSEIKGFLDFHKDSRLKSGRRNICKPCSNARATEWKSKNREKMRLLDRKKYHRNHGSDGIRRRERKRGLAVGGYWVLFRSQGGKCAICHSKPKEKSKLFIDHDHASGLVRGLLCPACNKGLGFFRDNSLSLFRACQYIGKNSKLIK